KARPALGILDGLPAGLAVAVGRGSPVDLLGAAGAAAGRALERPPDAEALAVLEEVELDLEAVAVLVDQLLGLLAAAAVVAEEGVGHAVKHGGLARAIEAGQHPQRGAVEGNLLLVFVAQEAFQHDTQRDHRLYLLFFPSLFKAQPTSSPAARVH